MFEITTSVYTVGRQQCQQYSSQHQGYANTYTCFEPPFPQKNPLTTTKKETDEFKWGKTYTPKYTKNSNNSVRIIQRGPHLILNT